MQNLSLNIRCEVTGQAICISDLTWAEATRVCLERSGLADVKVSLGCRCRVRPGEAEEQGE